MSILTDFIRPYLQRQASIPVGAVFTYAGRPLKVVKVMGDDPAAPVIVEELQPLGSALAGQYGLWSADGVTRAMGWRK